MEFRHLRYFLALADELHYGRAAQRLSITQPPLSLNIQQLEASVGARLFDRDSKGVRLTAAGRAFREAAQALVAGAEEARPAAVSRTPLLSRSNRRAPTDASSCWMLSDSGGCVMDRRCAARP